jgi:hypothetical protein
MSEYEARSRASTRTMIWEPQEREIRLMPLSYAPANPGGDYADYWLLDLAPDVCISLGMHPDYLDGDLAAMRRLAGTVAEAIRLLEERAAARPPALCTGPGCDDATHAAVIS